MGDVRSLPEGAIGIVLFGVDAAELNRRRSSKICPVRSFAGIKFVRRPNVSGLAFQSLFGLIESREKS
jgi:hypothetical protein